MDENNSSNRPKHSRKAKRGRSPLPWFLLFLVFAAGLLVYFLYFEQPPSPTQRFNARQDAVTEPESYQNVQQPSSLSPEPGEELTNEANSELLTSSGTSESLSEQQDAAGLVEETSTESLDTSSSEPKNPVGTAANSCEPALTTIQNFYTHLDGQEYLKPYQMDKPSERYFSDLLQKVVDNPPIVTGETDDLFNILKNTAHFFRIVGKKNIFILKAILDREKDSFEKVLADFYKLTSRPECLQERFNLTIPETALYDYAGFFLNTMGGRLYLFRRDSVSRMAVSYYSILIVDQANQNGTNKHGIDIAPSIKSLINELENSGTQLRMRDDYLEVLYMLETKYI